MYEFYIGVDLGQAQDYTAITILYQNIIYKSLNTKIPVYEVRHLERIALGTPYPKIIDRLGALLQKPEIYHAQKTMIVDQSGVGKPVVDMLRQADLCRIIGITITGGNEVNEVKGGFHVPKKELVAALQVLIQSERIKIAKDLEFADILKKEILNFKVKIDERTGHESFEAWREYEHDDLVLSTAIVAWYAFYVEPKSMATLRDYGGCEILEDWDIFSIQGNK